jgi:hypothetical protein
MTPNHNLWILDDSENHNLSYSSVTTLMNFIPFEKHLPGDGSGTPGAAADLG